METNELKTEIQDALATPIKRGRGRPPKNGVSKQMTFVGQPYNPEEDSRTIISDKVLSPYKIIVTENSFNVVDEVRPEGAIADNPYGYFSTLVNALFKIAKLKTTKNKTYSLKEYIDSFSQTIKELKDTVKF